MARATHIDSDAVRETYPSNVLASDPNEHLREHLGLRKGAIDTQTIVTFDSGAETAIIEGNIEVSTVREGRGAQTGTYGEYEILGGDVAGREGVAIVGVHYQPVVDAHAGDVDTFRDASGRWQRAIDDVGTASITSLADVRDRPWSVSGIAIHPTDSESVRMTTTMYFDSAAGASENRRLAKDAVPHESMRDGTWDVQSASVDGARVVVEATSTDFQL